MRFSCCITKITDTHSKYVIFNHFSTETVVTRTSFKITLYLHCFYCLPLNRQGLSWIRTRCCMVRGGGLTTRVMVWPKHSYIFAASSCSHSNRKDFVHFDWFSFLGLSILFLVWRKYLCSRCEIVDSVWYAVINVEAVQGLPDTNNKVLVMVPPDSRLVHARAHGWLSFISDQTYGAAKAATGFDFKLHWQLTLLRTRNAVYCIDGLSFIAFYDDM